MPSITIPTRAGYAFDGYYSGPYGSGTQYYTASGSSARSWNNTVPMTLYAKWTTIIYRVTLDRQGGSGGTESVTAVYGEDLPAITVPTRTGYTFGGYYTSKDGRGTQYFTASGVSVRTWDETAKTTLYAMWTANTYDVTLDRQGGSGGSSSVTAVYGDDMPDIAAPTRTGYSFAGYYDAANGGGTQYYTAAGAGARNWDKAAATTLYAKWTLAPTHTVTLDRQGGSGGTESVTAVYGESMPAITVPTRTGHTFGGYYTENNGGGTQYYTASGTSARSWDGTAATTLYAMWTANTYDVTLDRQGGSGGSASVRATYTWAMPAITRPTRTGYTFGGYYDAVNGGGTQYYKASGSSARGWDKTAATTLYAMWTGNAYDVTLDRQGGSGGSESARATYTSAMPAITLPTRTGYTFGGYYDAANGGGTQYYTASGASARNWDKTAATTLYAKWTANDYAVTLDRQGGSGGTASVTATYGSSMPDIAAPTRTGYSFAGYYDAANGGGTQYYTAAGAGARNWDKAAATTLYAKWTAHAYSVAFDKNAANATGSMSPESFDYGTAKTLTANAFTRSGYAFAGWATSPAGAKVYDDRQSVSNLTPTDGGVVTLYAVWAGNPYTISFNGAGGSDVASITAACGAALTAPPPPTRSGFTFTGWNPEFPPTMPEGGATLTAQWTKNYTISFDSAGGSAVEPITTGYGMALTAPAAPTRSGYTFAGWSPAFPATMPLGGATLVAQWTDLSRYTIEFDSAGGSAVAPIVAAVGTPLSAPAAPTKQGYVFAGWSPAFPATMPEGGAALVAQWTADTGFFVWTVSGNEATITGVTRTPAGALEIPSEIGGHPVAGVGDWAFSGCSGLTSISIQDGVAGIGTAAFEDCTGLTSISIPDSVETIADGAFLGCSGLRTMTIPDGVTSVGNSAFSGCTGLEAVFIPESLAGKTGSWGLPSGCRIVVGADVTVENVTVPKSWILERAPASLAAANDDWTSAARATAANGANKVWECYVAGLDPADPAEWFLAEVFFDENGNPRVAWTPDLGSARDYAVEGKASLADDWGAPDADSRFFRVLVSMPECVTISFDSAGGSEVAPISAIAGTALRAPTPPTKEGYTFAGWSPSFPGTMPAGGATLVAQWTPKNYTITFDSAGGSAVASITAAYGSSLTAPAAPTKQGYTFAGWSPKFPSKMPLGGATLVAQWTSIFTWTVSGNAVTITGFKKTPTGELGIPAEIDGHPVTSIGSSAFKDCSGLTSVTIPDSVTDIGNYAFSGCSGLTLVEIGNGVTRIGERAFYGCSDALFDTTGIPGVKLVDGWAVGYSSSLSGVLDLTGVRGIADGAFRDCSGLTSITIPDSVTSIGDYAFRACSGLTSVTIPDSVTSIGKSAFEWCSGLTSILIPDSVTSIGDYAFRVCSGLTSVTIPDGVTSIGDRAFSWCSGLTSVIIPNSVTSIGIEAFGNGSDVVFDTTSIPGVKLVDGWAVDHTSALSGVLDLTGVRGIADYAFSDCSGLTSVTIPNNVTSIGTRAFSNCSGLTSITIPNSVTSIGNYAFYGCSGLTSITIPDNVTSVGSKAFDGCSNLATISIPASLQGQTSDWGLPSTCQIVVRN